MLVVKVGESLVFEGRVCGSVGVEYRVECDETAFSVEYGSRYLDPKRAFLCEGGDKAIDTYKLTSLCVGEFDVYEVEGFRRKETSRTRYVVRVVPDEAKEYNEACELYKTLGAEKYALHPYGKEALGEDMHVVNQVVCGCWKPRYLIDDRSKTAVEFMSEVMTLQTVDVDDIDWKSFDLVYDSFGAMELFDVVGYPTFKSFIVFLQYVISRARRLNASYLTVIHNYKDGVAEVAWQLYPDDRYRTDEDGYEATDDDEKITVYGFVDRAGKPLVKFRYIYDVSELAEMEKEARENLASRS